MNIKGTSLALLPEELQDMIFDIVYKVQKKEVLEELANQLRVGLLPDRQTKHSILTTKILEHDHENRFYDLIDYYDYINQAGLIGDDSRHRIDNVIKGSSPFFLYIEDLSYQELIEFWRWC